MLNIKNKNVKSAGHTFDFELENGILLHTSEWNGEKYTTKEDKKEITYTPIYKFQTENIDVSEIEENSKEYFEAYEIVGFEEF